MSALQLTNIAGLGFGVIVVALTALGLRGRSAFSITRRTALYCGIGWVFLVTAEYWIFGSRSFVTIEDEGEFTLPLLAYMSDFFLGGRFAHHLDGGTDIYSATPTGTAFFSFDLILFKALPTWFAFALHKISVAAILFIGAYRLARWAGAGRELALALGAWATQAHAYALLITVSHGYGYALAPLGVYLFISRIGKRGYVIGCLILGLLHATSFTPTHSALSFWPALLFCWLILSRKAPLLFFSVFGFSLLVGALNQAETIVSMIQSISQSSRGMTILAQNGLDLPFRLFTRMDYAVLTLGSLTVLIAVRAYRQALLSAGMVVAMVGGSAVLLSLPWTATPLAFLQSFDFSYMTFSLPPVIIVLTAWAERAARQRIDGNVKTTESVANRLIRIIPLVMTAVLCLGNLSSAKAWNSVQWLLRGGQSSLYSHPNLREADWAPTEPYRVATIPYRLRPITLNALGFQAVDSIVNLTHWRKALFWNTGFPFMAGTTCCGMSFISQQFYVDFLCCDRYPVERVTRLRPLKVLGARYLVSVVPLDGDDLRLVSGPADGFVPPRRNDGLTNRILGLAAANLSDHNAYVYELQGALPLAYGASGIERADEWKSYRPETFPFDAILAGRAFMTASEQARLGQPADIPGPVIVLETSLVRDGYDIEINATKGGLLIVNAIAFDQWEAHDQDGKKLDLAPANLIHTAIALPAGTRKVRLRYHQPGVFGYPALPNG